MRRWKIAGGFFGGLALIACAAAAAEQDLASTPVAELGRLTGEYTALYQQGELARAAEVAGQALQVAEQAFGATDARVAQVLNDVGRLQAGQGQHEQALASDQRALQIRRQQPAADAPAVVQSLRNLANDYQQLQRFAEADPALVEALALLTQALAADHPHRLDALADLALLRMQQGAAAAAEPLFAELETHTVALNRLDTAKVVAVWQGYSQCLAQLGRQEQASAFQQRAATMQALMNAAKAAP